MQPKQTCSVKKWAVIGAFVSAGIIYGGSGIACASYGAEAALSSIDFCFLLDCQNGAFGGLIDPCNPGGFVLGRDEGLVQEGGPVLFDCPVN